ncbi:hypothetical protein CP532_1470 [Ophiocordyceps camponoti-leonardi (nom. inval.)]|nr:hypothetical protein CP532_1470 [Ophiocordyceps camponoti-leonardi (nom. inval.)]
MTRGEKAKEKKIMRPAITRRISDETTQRPWLCYGFLLWSIVAVQLVVAVTGEDSPSPLSPIQSLSRRFDLVASRARTEAQRHSRLGSGSLRKYDLFQEHSLSEERREQSVDDSHQDWMLSCSGRGTQQDVDNELSVPGGENQILEENCIDWQRSSSSSSPSHGRHVDIEMTAPNADILSPLGEGWHSSSMFTPEIRQDPIRGPVCVTANLPAVTPKREPMKFSIVTNATLSRWGVMSSEGGTAQAGFICYDLFAVIATRPCVMKKATCGPLLADLDCDPRDLRAARRRAKKPSLCAIDVCTDITIPRNWRDYRVICWRPRPDDGRLVSLVCKQRFGSWAGQCSTGDLSNEVW